MSDKLKYALILDLKGNFARMTASAQKAMNRFAQTGEAGLKRMAKAMPAVGSALDKLGNRYTALISGGTMYAAVKSAAAMETRLTRLGITADKSNEEMRKLNEEIYKIAQNRGINVSADSIISGMEEIVAKTGDFDAAAENIKNLGLVISATGASGEDAGAMIADLIEKFGIKTPKELLETLDLLASQGKAGSFELKDLATQGNRVMSAYAGIGRTGKTATTELGTLMQIIRKGVGSSEQAATALEAYMRALNDVQTRERLKNSGISLFEDDDPKKMRSAVEIMKDVIAKANGDISKIGQVFISSEAMRAFSAAALEFQKTKTFGSLDSFMNVNADGTALIGDSERMAATFESSVVSLKMAVERFSNAALAEPIKELSDALNKIDPEKMQSALKTAAIGVGAVGALVAGKKLWNVGAGIIGMFRKNKGGALNTLVPANGVQPVYVTNFGEMGGGFGGYGAGYDKGGRKARRAANRAAKQNAKLAKAGRFGKFGAFMGKTASFGGKLLSKAAVPLMVADAGYSLYASDNNSDRGNALGSLGGTLGGAKAGALLGTMIAPGVGTAVGSLIGSGIGYLSGSWIGKKIGGWFDDAKQKGQAEKIVQNGTIRFVFDNAPAGLRVKENPFGFNIQINTGLTEAADG